MDQDFYHLLQVNPVIAAVKNSGELEEATASDVEAIFLLGGNICELQAMIQMAHRCEKKLYIHLDLLEGIGRDFFALKHLKETWQPDGVLTTKANLVKFARELEIFVIQRFFMLDSMSYDGALKAIRTMEPDAVEIMPGILPKIIEKVHARYKVPIIAGGLISTKRDAIDALAAGALGVSTSAKALWNM